MSRLIQMKQRIKAIETIKKVTHAMRLISMSTHARMQHKIAPMRRYQQAIKDIFSKALGQHPQYQNKILKPQQPTNKRPLAIIIGSQKGLCGSFNSNLFHTVENELLKELGATRIITVGKHATNFIKKKQVKHHIAHFDIFGLHNFLTIADSLLAEITEADPTYSSVSIYRNNPLSFFVQQPQKVSIIPAEFTSEASATHYSYQQKSTLVLDHIAQEYLLAQVQHALFESLLAEHSARFVSMDNATRNAQTLLEQMQLNYNKLRQTKITRELTELSSFFIE